MSAKAAAGTKTIALNKKVRQYYELLDFFEAGLVLTGSEVKSLREGRVSFKDGYVRFIEGEAWLIGIHIAPYENAGYAQHDPDRERKLLLHGREIHLLQTKVEQKGLTVVPTKMYFKNGRAKLEVALARGKDTVDRRDTLKKKAVQRDMEREMARRR